MVMIVCFNLKKQQLSPFQFKFFLNYLLKEATLCEAPIVTTHSPTRLTDCSMRAPKTKQEKIVEIFFIHLLFFESDNFPVRCNKILQRVLIP
jgi:hypothetical protein